MLNVQPYQDPLDVTVNRNLRTGNYNLAHSNQLTYLDES
ncbi:hypothetical protein NMG60_11008013 [Bertholletia excelsa]